jgi:hypothetical protein
MLKRFLLLVVAGLVHGGFQLSPKYLREVEKKHGRVALLALPTLAALSATGHVPATSWLASQPTDLQAIFFSSAAVVEAGATLPRFKERLELRDSVEPGRFFDLGPGSPELNKLEDAGGRVAMGATVAWMLTDLLV